MVCISVVIKCSKMDPCHCSFSGTLHGTEITFWPPAPGLANQDAAGSHETKLTALVKKSALEKEGEAG